MQKKDKTSNSWTDRSPPVSRNYSYRRTLSATSCEADILRILRFFLARVHQKNVLFPLDKEEHIDHITLHWPLFIHLGGDDWMLSIPPAANYGMSIFNF